MTDDDTEQTNCSGTFLAAAWRRWNLSTSSLPSSMLTRYRVPILYVDEVQGPDPLRWLGTGSPSSMLTRYRVLILYVDEVQGPHPLRDGAQGPHPQVTGYTIILARLSAIIINIMSLPIITPSLPCRVRIYFFLRRTKCRCDESLASLFPHSSPFFPSHTSILSPSYLQASEVLWRIFKKSHA